VSHCTPELSRPRVSVITPYRNGARFLNGFVAMLQAQTFAHWCCLLVDDGSSDGGPQLAAALTDADPRFVLLHRAGAKPAGSGPAAARNLALAQVETPWVAFCDIDDLWHPQKLAHQLAFQQQHQLDLVVTGYARFRDGASSQPQPLHWRCPPAALSYKGLLGGNPIPMLTVLVRAALVRDGMPAIPHEDFALWLQLFRDQPALRYGCLSEGLAFYRVHAHNLSGQRWRMLGWTWQVFRSHGLQGLALGAAVLRWALYQASARFSPSFSRPALQPSRPLAEWLLAAPVCLRPSSN